MRSAGRKKNRRQFYNVSPASKGKSKESEMEKILKNVKTG